MEKFFLKLTHSYSDLPYKVSIPLSSARPSVSTHSIDSDPMNDNISVEDIRISPNKIPHGVYKEQNISSASEINFSR